MISTFFYNNILILRVVYAILFFLYGFAIVLKINRKSGLKLARSLWLLAVYGFLFGINELITIAMFVKKEALSAEMLFVVGNIQLFLRAFAYMVILWLGVRLVCDVYTKMCRFFGVVKIMTLVWTLMAVYTLGFRYNQLSFGVIDNLARYMFAIPGLFLSGYGLLLHAREIEQFKVPSLVKHVKGLAYTFFAGVFLIGMIASHPVLWPAIFLNRETFEAVVRVPIIFFRSIYLIAVTYFVIKIVNVFEVERELRLEEALKRQVLAEERDRIARELHDGIIQSIYGVGLKMKQHDILRDKRSDEAETLLGMVKKDLDNVIRDIRDYIEELHLDDYSCISLKEAVLQMVIELRENAVMNVDISIEGKQAADLNVVQVNHILQIIRELLSNVTKHSRASTVGIKVMFKEQELIIRVSDNGVGFNPNERKLSQHAGKAKGLNNIFHRINMLQGAVVFHTAPGQGTHYEITFPYSKLNYLQSAYIEDDQYFVPETINGE